MQLAFRNIILRDMKPGDEEDMVRWMTVQTEWHEHDSPWLAEKDFNGFDPEKYRRDAREYLRQKKHTGERINMQIEDRKTGKHIGFVTSYGMDKHCEPQPVGAEYLYIAVGIDICEPLFRGEHRGTHALLAYMQYVFSFGWPVLFLQTWNGNQRMMHVARKIGFKFFKVKKGNFEKRGVVYDNLTFYIKKKVFHENFTLGERISLRLQALRK